MIVYNEKTKTFDIFYDKELIGKYDANEQTITFLRHIQISQKLVNIIFEDCKQCAANQNRLKFQEIHKQVKAREQSNKELREKIKA